MSAENGIIRTKSKGRKKFAIGEEGEPFEIDVIRTLDEWILIDRSFRGEDGKIIDLLAWKQESKDFIERVSGEKDLDDSTVLEFLALLQEEAGKLQGFFVPKPVEKPSLLEPTTARLTFSQ